MNLDKKLANTLHEINANQLLSWQEIIPLIDLTLLDTNATITDINQLASNANKYQVAALCVLPEHLDYISPEILVKRATVVNFPTGDQLQQQVLNTISRVATHKPVDEIDYVFPYKTYLAGDKTAALTYCFEVYRLCKQHDLVFKVILETGALTSCEVIYEISTAILQNGCDFLKTSTGKITKGATLPAVFSILSAIVDSHVPCGIKISGGVKTEEQALTYMRLAQHMLNHPLDSSCFRLGASSLLNDLVTRQ
jgi:deoxyribose-phosphate aldolase